MRRIVISIPNSISKTTSTSSLAPSVRNFNVQIGQQQQQQTGNIDRKPIVTVFGGNGFVGRQLISKLAPHCAQIKVGSTHADEFNRFSQQHFGDVVRATQVNVKDAGSVEYLVEGSDAVINLSGIYYESDDTFVDVFVKGSGNISLATTKLDVPLHIHLGLLGTDVDVKSRYADMMARATDMSYAANPNTISLLSAPMFGPKNTILNNILKGFALSPFLLVPMRSQAKIQPVHVGDVTEAIKKLVTGEATKQEHLQNQRIVELAGPKVYNWRELLSTVSSKPVAPVPYFLVDSVCGLEQFLPEPFLTRDHILLEDIQMVESKKHPTLKNLGITPKPLEGNFNL